MFMDRWGRKKVLIIGGVGMGVSQLIVGTLYAVYKDSWASNKSAGWAAAFFVWAYIANFAFSIGCVNWIVPSEIFPPGVRSQAVGLAIGTNWLSNVSQYEMLMVLHALLTLRSSSLLSSLPECLRRSRLAHFTSFWVSQKLLGPSGA